MFLKKIGTKEFQQNKVEATNCFGLEPGWFFFARNFGWFSLDLWANCGKE